MICKEIKSIAAGDWRMTNSDGSSIRGSICASNDEIIRVDSR